MTLKEKVRAAQSELPTEVDRYTTLVSIKENNTGSLDFWYEITDEGARICRQFGRDKLRTAATKLLDTHEFGVDFSDTDVTIHHIFENKHGTHMFSFTDSPDAVDGKVAIGKTQSNPFAIQNVSAKGGSKQSSVSKD